VIPTPRSGESFNDSYDDVVLHDAQMLEEIELLGELMVLATTAMHSSLSTAEIDAALGISVTDLEISA
jgi:hypothetical protein